MEEMQNGLEEDDPTLTVFGCLSHWFNLLDQDITPSCVQKHIAGIQKYFRNHHLPAAWLKECDGSIKKLSLISPSLLSLVRLHFYS